MQHNKTCTFDRGRGGQFKITDDRDVSDTGPRLPPGQIFVLDLDDVISAEECDFIVKAINTYKVINVEKWGKSTNVQCNGVGLRAIEREDVSISNTITDILQKAFDKLRKVMDGFVDITGVQSLQLREIHGATRPHYDAHLHKADDRVLSVIIALNDDYNGGIINFPEQSFSHKLRKLQMIAFPPFWTHPHYVTKPLDGTVRYTVNTWLTLTPSNDDDQLEKHKTYM